MSGVSKQGVTLADRRIRAAVDQHLDLVWRVLRRAGLAPADAEDAAQDVFWVLAQRVGDVPERAERSFLLSTAFRVALDCKRSKWHRAVEAAQDLDASAAEGLLPDQALELRRAQHLLDEALEALSDDERAIFILAELEQMTRAEIAQAVGIPEGTVASRLSRARQTLEARLRKLRRTGK